MTIEHIHRLHGATQVQYEERQRLIDLLSTSLVPHRTIAIDGGAHVGTWTETLAAEFNFVHAFEPGPAFENLEANSAGWKNVAIHRAALMDRACRVRDFHRKRGGKPSGQQISRTPKGRIPGVTIDSLDLPACGLIKLDIEGCEYLALQGARQTIRNFRPFLLVEIAGRGTRLGYRDKQVLRLLDSMEYQPIWSDGVDFGFVHQRKGKK